MICHPSLFAALIRQVANSNILHLFKQLLGGQKGNRTQENVYLTGQAALSKAMYAKHRVGKPTGTFWTEKILI